MGGSDFGCLIAPDDRILCWGNKNMVGSGEGDFAASLPPVLEAAEPLLVPEWLAGMGEVVVP